MTMRMQKRDSFVTGYFAPCMPEYAGTSAGSVLRCTRITGAEWSVRIAWRPPATRGRHC